MVAIVIAHHDSNPWKRGLSLHVDYKYVINGIVPQKMTIYSLFSCSKPVSWVSFFCLAQKKIILKDTGNHSLLLTLHSNNKWTWQYFKKVHYATTYQMLAYEDTSVDDGLDKTEHLWI